MTIDDIWIGELSWPSEEVIVSKNLPQDIDEESAIRITRIPEIKLPHLNPELEFIRQLRVSCDPSAFLRSLADVVESSIAERHIELVRIFQKCNFTTHADSFSWQNS